MATVFEKIIRIKSMGVKQAAKDMDKVGSSTKDANSQLVKMAKYAAGLGVLVVVARKIAKGISEATKEAIDAEETISKFGTVFRDISSKADSFAKNLADNFGLAKVEAKGLLADTGDLLTGFGFTQESALDLSNQVQELAVDLASFTNYSGGAEGASKALTKALLGERESVKSLGISILEEDVKAKMLIQSQQGLTFESERQAKAYATLTIAQEQSQNAIGDFARTSDQTANQIRIAKAAIQDWRIEMGSNFTPIVNKGAEAVAEFFKRATETSLETTIRQLGELGASAEQLNRLQSMADVENYFNSYAENVQTVEKQYKKLGNTYDKEVLQLLGKEIVQRKSVAQGVNEQLNTYNELTPNQEKYNNSLANMASMTASSVDNFKEVVEVVDENKLTIENLDSAIGILTEKSFKYGRQWKEATESGRESIGEQISQNAKQIKSLQELKNLLVKIKEDEDKFNGAIKETTVSTEDKVIAVKILDTAIGELGKKYEWTEEQLTDFKTSFDKLSEDMLTGAGEIRGITLSIIPQIQMSAFGNVKASLDDALKSGELSQAEYDIKLKALTPQQIEEGLLVPLEEIPEDKRVIDVDIRTDFQKFQDEYMDNIDAIGDMVTDVAGAAADIWSNVIEARYEKELRSMKEMTEYQKADVDTRAKMEQDLNEKYAEERTKQAKFAKAMALMEATVNTATAVMKAFTIDPTGILAIATGVAGLAQIGVIASEPIPAYATGGYVDRPQLALVGESGGEGILNASTTQRLGGRAGIDALNKGGSVGNTLNMTFNNLTIWDENQLDRLAEQISDRSKLGFNEIEVKYN